MKTLTLYQPWATLVAIGAKRVETRSWPTKYRGKLAIHASKNRRFIDMGKKEYILNEKWFDFVLREWVLEITRGEYLEPYFPLGSIVATCELHECYQVEHGNQGPWRLLSDKEIAFGDYTPGRYMWMLGNIKKLTTPVAAKGAMGIWEWKEDG